MLPQGLQYAMNNSRGINYAKMTYQLMKAGAPIRLNYQNSKWGEDRNEIAYIGTECFIRHNCLLQPNLDSLCCPVNNDADDQRIRALLKQLWNEKFPNQSMPMITK